MDRKKLWIPILIGILALALAAVLLLTGRDASTPPTPAETTGAVQTAPVLSQTDPTLPTEDAATVPSGPEETEPEQTEPERDDPPATDPKPTKPAKPEETEPVQTEPPATVPAPENLAELEGGLLTVRNLFQFTGMNPDAENEFGEDIAGIEMTNHSGQLMTFAEVTVILTDGTVLTFQAEDIPAGRTVLAFSLENASIRDTGSCEDVYGYAEFDSSDPLAADLVRTTVSGQSITVKNVSGTDLTDLNVSCHGLLDTSFFGGSTYRYTISTLPAGASTTIYAEECFLGMVEVVRVELGG